MRFPLSLSFDLSRYLTKQRLQGEEKFPLVLMLEPTHQCNLSCQGCGRIQEYRETLGQALTLQECLQAVEDCGAPVVTMCPICLANLLKAGVAVEDLASLAGRYC